MWHYNSKTSKLWRNKGCGNEPVTTDVRGNGKSKIPAGLRQGGGATNAGSFLPIAFPQPTPFEPDPLKNAGTTYKI